MSSRYGRLKQLEPVGPSGEALLDYAVFDGLRAGFGRVVLVVRREIVDELRAHVARRWRDVEVVFVEQTLDQVPDGCTVPAGRAKPWGTAHAVLAAAAVVEGACAVANADDFYGAGAYALLADHLRAPGTEHALVAYGLAATLSPSGGVSRGICEVRAGLVHGIDEVVGIERRDGTIVGLGVDGRTRHLAADAPTSMNLWGFRPDIFGVLRDAFARFWEDPWELDTREFLLSSAIGERARDGTLRVRALGPVDTWMGMTYADDRRAVQLALAGETAAGAYPERLGTGKDGR